MEYFQTAWRDGSSLNKGLTSEEFFYNQIYNALEVNVANRTLPFFNSDAKTVPVELSTGKIINDENLIALEQISSKKGYSSNVWIYGDVLDKIRHPVELTAGCRTCIVPHKICKLHSPEQAGALHSRRRLKSKGPVPLQLRFPR